MLLENISAHCFIFSGRRARRGAAAASRAAAGPCSAALPRPRAARGSCRKRAPRAAPRSFPAGAPRARDRCGRGPPRARSVAGARSARRRRRWEFFMQCTLFLSSSLAAAAEAAVKVYEIDVLELRAVLSCPSIWMHLMPSCQVKSCKHFKVSKDCKIAWDVDAAPKMNLASCAV